MLLFIIWYLTEHSQNIFFVLYLVVNWMYGLFQYIKLCDFYTTTMAITRPSATYMHQWMGSAFVQIMACRLFGNEPISKPMLKYCYISIGPLRTNFSEISIEIQNFPFIKMHLKIPSMKVSNFVLGRWVNIGVKYCVDFPNTCVHSLCFFGHFCPLVMVDFTHILQDYFTDTVAIKGYSKINH